MTRSAFELVLENDDIADLEPAARRLALREIVTTSDHPDKQRLLTELVDHLDGWGPLTGLTNDPHVTDVFVNRYDDVWVERAGRIEATDVRFGSEAEFLRFIHRTLGRAGGRADMSAPVADVATSDGSRFHVVMPPLARGGPFVSIRRFPATRSTLEDLAALGMLGERSAQALKVMVAERRSIVVSGGTGSGKTTLLGALLQEVGRDERIVTIEETSELRPDHPHVVPLLGRPPNVEGSGEVELIDLVRTALRMRPDRIVVGEVRGGEALAALDAMATGHPGSMMTVHSSSAAGARTRVAALAQRAPGAPRYDVVERLAEEVLDVVIHLGRRDGIRCVEEIVTS